MVKFKVTKQKNRSGDKFWVVFSDKIEDGKMRKLHGFLSMVEIKVQFIVYITRSVNKNKVYNFFLDHQENNVGGKGTDQV